MSSYSVRNPMISEATAGASASHFAWFYPGSYFPFPRTTGMNLSQVAQANPAGGIAAPPVRIFPSIEEPRNDMKPVKPTKQNSKTQSPSKSLKPKPPRRKNPSSQKAKKTPIFPEMKREKKNPDINIDISSFDFSGVPSPVCSCTGVARVCYKWGVGGWQSSCCTISISKYPLPMSTTRPGARLAGRKMSNGAYVKLLLRLAGEGYDLSHPVDLKNHWARHGTNKFITIK